MRRLGAKIHTTELGKDGGVLDKLCNDAVVRRDLDKSLLGQALENRDLLDEIGEDVVGRHSRRGVGERAELPRFDNFLGVHRDKEAARCCGGELWLLLEAEAKLVAESHLLRVGGVLHNRGKRLEGAKRKRERERERERETARGVQGERARR